MSVCGCAHTHMCELTVGRWTLVFERLSLILRVLMIAAGSTVTPIGAQLAYNLVRVKAAAYDSHHVHSFSEPLRPAWKRMHS